MEATADVSEGSPSTLVPTEISTESQDRSGEAVNEGRIEELLRAGFRPKDARRIERLERTLDLPAEKDELDRVRAAAACRSDPDARREAMRQIAFAALDGEIVPYEALKRLHKLEIEEESLNFARVVDKASTPGKTRKELVLYHENGTATKTYRRKGTQVEVKDISMSAWYANLPE